MTSEELEKLAKECKKDDPNTAIVLLVLAGAKLENRDNQFASYCRRFSQMAIYNMDYNDWLEKG